MAANPHQPKPVNGAGTVCCTVPGTKPTAMVIDSRGANDTDSVLIALPVRAMPQRAVEPAGPR